MTDNEIIKALEYCTDYPSCPTDCPLFEQPMDCLLKLSKPTLDLINRQKAEIERLEIKIEGVQEANAILREHIRKAVKEFAERYKALLETELAWCECVDEITKPLDNLVKEMVGEG